MYSAGTVFLQVVPSYRGFQESVRRQAKEAAKAFKGEFEKETGHRIADAIDKAGPDAKRAAQRLGTDVGNEMAGKTNQAIQKQITAALRSLPKIKVDADTTPLKRAIAAARAELETLGRGHANLDLDAGAVLAQLAAVQASLVEINALAKDDLDLDIDTAGAVASLARLEGLADAATHDRTINIDVDTGAANAQLAATAAAAHRTGASGDDAANSFRAFNGVVLAAVGLGPLLIPILAGLVGGLAAVGPMAIAAASGLGVLVLGLSGIPGAVGALNDVAKNGAKDALAASKTMRSATNAVRDAQQNLTRARQQAARTEADSARRVADARRQLADAERVASERIQDALDAEKDARRNLRDVTLQVNREIEQAERRVADAHRNLARTREDVARRNADAAEDIARAERGVVEAQQSALKAQEDLTEARREAARDLEDLAAKAAGGALAEREAVLALADAKKQYDRVMGREFKSARSVEEVTLAYEEAQLALANIRRENARTAEELAAANAAGVEGSERVQTAQERLAEARQAEADAAAALADARAEALRVEQDGQEAIADAIRDQRDAREALRQSERDGARDIADAQAAIREAVQNTRDVRAEAARSIADAERGVTNAIREQREAAVDSARSIRDAQQGIADAQQAYADALQTTGEIGSSSMQKLQEAMDALSPAGRKFARFIFGLKDEFMALRAVAEAGLLPGLQDFLTMIIDTYGPGFTKWVGEMAQVAGDLFRMLGEVMTTNPAWKEFFAAFGKMSPRLFRQFGETTINWLTVFVALLDAFLPLAEKASGWLLDMSEKAAKWATGLEDTKGFKDFMGYLDRVLPKVGEFFAALVGAALNLVEALAPYGELLLEVFTGILNFIAGMSPGVLAAIVFGIIAITVALQVAYGVMTLMLIGFTAFQVTVGAWVAVSVLVVAALIAMYLKFEWFRDGVNFIFKALGEIIGAWWDYTKWIWGQVADLAVWLWENALAPTFDAIGKAWQAMVRFISEQWDKWGRSTWEAIQTAAKWLWENVLSPVFGYIKSGWQTLATAIGWVWNNIWFPIIDLVGTIIWELWKLYFKVAFEAIQLGWEVLGAVFGTVWREVLKPVFGFIADALGVGAGGLQWVFSKAVEGIKTIWDGLEAIAKKPIKFIVETVLNNGLIAGFNKIAGFFGTKEMGEIPLPKGWATGGYTGAGGRYEPAGIVHRDEFVVSSPARRRFEQRNPGALDYLNRTGSLPGYATGGIVRPVAAAPGLRFGNTYSDGSFHSGQDFPVGLGTKVVAALMGVVSKVLHLADSYGNHIVVRHPGGAETLYAHLSRTMAGVGDIVGAGTAIGLSGSSGNSSGPHLHFEFRKPPGGYSNAVDPLGILGGAPMPSGDGGFLPGWMSNPFGWLKDKVGGLVDKIPGGGRFLSLVKEVPLALLGMAGDGIGNLAKGVLGKAGDIAGGAWDFVNGPFGGAGEGATLYDTGGVLPTGMTNILNASGKPEAVLTNSQWAAIERVGNGGAGGGLTVHGDLVAADPDEMVGKIRTSQSDAAAVANLRDIAAGV